MKNLFFVSVAAGIFSGTSISVTAQTSVNTVKIAAPAKKPLQFIEDIEIKQEVAKAADEVDIWELPVKKPTISTIPAAKKITSAATNSSIAKIETCTPLQFKFAQIMDTEVESITNIKLYTAIEDWWATHYRYGGITKRGIDCSALTGTLVNEGFGVELPRTARAQFAACEKIARENLQEGDLVFFNTTGGISHVGLYLWNNYFVHASVHNGVTISSLTDNYYSRKYIGAGRFKN
jgi:lipoprotein Spr